VDLIEEIHLPGSGPIDSVKKQELPAPSKVHIGHLIDPQAMKVSVTDERRIKNVAVINNVLEDVSTELSVGRRDWSTVVGKLQFTATVVRGMQAELSTAYSPLYRVMGRGTRAPDFGDWSAGAMIQLAAGDMDALERVKVLYADAANCERRFYYSPTTGTSGFWTGDTNDTHVQLDHTSTTSEGVPVYTGDASGFAAGVWHKDLRHIHYFSTERAAPNMSSNYRELVTALLGLHQWATRWTGSRLLYRSDNSTTVAIINKGGTMAPDLLPVITDINKICIQEKIDLAASHIPGVINTRADLMSRWVRTRDDGDWRLMDEVFDQVHSVVSNRYMGGHSFTLDGSADPAGTNAMLPRFRSPLDSILTADLRGEHLWCNPDFKIAGEVLKWFLKAYQEAPLTTSGTFLLPEWPDRPFWNHVKGARVIARFSENTPLFTSPDWRKLQLPGGGFSFANNRSFRGNTRWPVVVIHFPCVVDNRGRGSPRNAPRMAVRRGLHDRVPPLRGDAVLDGAFLRTLPHGVM
jgi:hypothetical protein